MNVIRMWICVLVCMLAAAGVFAQGSKRLQQSQVFIDYGDRFFGEALVVPLSADTASLIVLFRMANDFLSFTRVADRADLGGNFKADVTVGIEVRDTIGVIRQRVSWRGTAYANTFEMTNSKTDFTHGWATLQMPAGKYVVTLEIISQKESSQKRITLPAVEFAPHRSNLPVALPLVGETVDGEEALRPFVYGGAVPFQSKDAEAVVLTSDAVSRVYDVRIDQEPYDDKSIRWWTVGDVEGVATSQPGLLPEISEYSTSQRPLVRLTQTNVATISSLRVRIPVSEMVPGKYTMRLVPRGGVDTLKLPLAVYWEMMPLSLRNLTYAMTILKYVVSDSVHAVIDEGTDAERRMKLMNYWRERDPTPSTTFNEHLYEYYRRVDQAFYAYSTIQEPDGARSERGKIYILHGAPTAVKKSLSPKDKPQEIWTYSNKVNKVFVFELEDNGTFKLRDIQAAR